jgi:catechol 2,3-dioxygenase-like lactoylglutathione lyase family enzyme
MSDTIRLSQIGQIAVPVQDLDRAIAFYRDILGMSFLFRVPNLAFFDCAGVRLMLSTPEAEQADHPGSVLYFNVDDIHAAHRELLARSVEFVDAPHMIARMESYDLWMAFFRDGQGNTHAIMGEQRP